MNREKSPNSGIFASPGSFLWENISLLIDVCSCNGLESLRSILLRVLLMYSQYTWKVHTNYIQLKGFQNVSLKALPFSSKFPDELPGGWFFSTERNSLLSEMDFPQKWATWKGVRWWPWLHRCCAGTTSSLCLTPGHAVQARGTTLPYPGLPWPPFPLLLSFVLGCAYCRGPRPSHLEFLLKSVDALGAAFLCLFSV